MTSSWHYDCVNYAKGLFVYGWFGGVWNYPFTAFSLSSSQHQVMHFQKWCQAYRRPISPMKCPPSMASLILCNCTMTILPRSVCVRCAGEWWEVCRVSGVRCAGWVHIYCMVCHTGWCTQLLRVHNCCEPSPTGTYSELQLHSILLKHVHSLGGEHLIRGIDNAGQVKWW